MANGEVLTPLVKAHELTQDRLYLDTAKELLNSFFVKVADGGVTYKDSYSVGGTKNMWRIILELKNLGC
jgi:hypothetical protein